MTAPPTFSNRRLALWFLAPLLIVLLGLGASWYENYEPWRPLPGGGEVRLQKVDYGEVLTVMEPGLQLDTLREWLGPAFERLIGPYPGGYSAGSAGSGSSSLAVVFICRGAGNYSVLDDAHCDIDLANGQTLQGDFGGGGGSNNYQIKPAYFSIVPLFERQLNIRLEVQGKTFRYSVRNPAYVAERPAWKAGSLPQSRTLDGFDFTLKNVTSAWIEDRWWVGSPWGFDAEFSVRTEGKDVTPWMRCNTMICDPLGNESRSGIFSEPVWKLRCTAVRGDTYPYRDAEVTWLGPVTVPGPGEWRMIPLAAQKTQLSLLALLGPGRYLVVGDRITPMSGPPHPEAHGSPIWNYYPDQNKPDGGGEHTEIVTTSIQLLQMALTGLAGGQEGGPPDLFMRDESGRRLPLTTSHSSGSTYLFGAPIHAGTRELEAGLVEVHEMKTEFFIKPPPPPPAPEATRPKIAP